MTHNGGQQHAVGYRGQDYAVSVWDEQIDDRIIIAWRNTPLKWAEMRALETKPTWSAARCEPVKDRKTGAP